MVEQLQFFLDSWSNPIMAACAIYIAKSIQELNVKIAVIIEKVDGHEHRINRLEDETSARD